MTNPIKDNFSASPSALASNAVSQLSDLASSVGRAVIPIVMQPPQSNQESFVKRMSQLFDEPPIEFECELAGSSGLTKRVSEAVARNFTNPGNFFDGQIEFGNSAEKSAGHKRKDPFAETGKSSKKEEDSAPSSETRIKHVGLNGFNEKTFDIWRNWRIGKKYEGEVSALDLISLCRGCQFITEERGLFAWGLATLFLHPDFQVDEAKIILAEFGESMEVGLNEWKNLYQPNPLQRKKIIEKFAYAGHLSAQIALLNEMSWLEKREEGPYSWIVRLARKKDHTDSQKFIITHMHEVNQEDTKAALERLKEKGNAGDLDVIRVLFEFDSFLYLGLPPKKVYWLNLQERIYWGEKLLGMLIEGSKEFSQVALQLTDWYIDGRFEHDYDEPLLSPEIMNLATAEHYFKKVCKDPQDPNISAVLPTMLNMGIAYEKAAKEGSYGSSPPIPREVAEKKAFQWAEKAVELFEQGADADDAIFYYERLAECYEKGFGTEQSSEKAAFWSKKLDDLLEKARSAEE